MAAKREPRIGLFLCHCGKNIAGGLDLEALAESSKGLAGIAYVTTHKFCCSEGGQAEIAGAIRGQNLDRVIVAACEPSLHLLTFQRCGEEAGIEPQFADLVDIRKWTMPGSPQKVDPGLALEESRKTVELAVKRMRLKRPVPLVTVKAEQAALVIGGGIAGLEAALDLADKGYQVHVVERQPTIGGKMALLYKVYPTNDCAPCILAPKTAYANIHPKIELLTNAEVRSVKGHVGGFRVEIVQSPRYVDTDTCTGCGDCVAACPRRVRDDVYAAGLGPRKAVFIPYDQAIPRKAVIDAANCLYFRNGTCRLCEKACLAGAIDFNQQPRTIGLSVGAIIVATGFEEYVPSAKTEYGFGRFGNVVTQFQLARLLDIDGPTKGRLLRPTDGREPRTIVMIQCVGSRDETAHPYCSGICCMYVLKHAQIIREMVLPETEIHICYIDMRTPGKGFEEYYRRTRDMGILFIHGKPSEVAERPETKSLVVKVEDMDIGRPLELEADLVVLSCASVPPAGSEELSRILGIERDDSGFFKELHPKLRPVETRVRGVYLCGAAQGPKDIPASILQARAAASFADGELRRGTIRLPASMVKAEEIEKGGA
ncbi:MAG: CoB--CoM heterodisulfide reductase iron-sulfur subunit A family protein [Candidatus Aminicenantes bacterium]|nr:CoB--CoM heterodisulfide reductase iron-sulfur subunit A family protein [Candidatus Aminicenantes bacterium]